MNFYTADSHHSHCNIIKYCNRPFKDVQEMNNTLVDHINERVGEDDTLYHLGDWSFGPRNPKGAYEIAKDFRDQIQCKNVILIEGNHDRVTPEFRRLFKKVAPLLEVYDSYIKQKIVLCHYSMRVWNASYHGRFHLFGHSHSHLEEETKNTFSFDVGVDCHDFYPINSHDVTKEMQRRRDVGVCAPCERKT